MPETALGDDAIESAGYLDEAAERGAADEVLEGADESTPGSRLDEGADEIPRTEADEAEGAA